MGGEKGLMPVHYDIEAAEREIRANIAKTQAERVAAANNGKLPMTEAVALNEFDEARVQFVLAGMRCENAGIDRNDMLACAGYAVGSAWANALHAALGARERHLVNTSVERALVDNIGETAAAKTINSVLRPMEAGNA